MITHAGPFGSIVYIQMLDHIGKLNKNLYQIHIVKIKQLPILIYLCLHRVIQFQTMHLLFLDIFQSV